MSARVKTPAGKGRLTGAAQVIGGWLVRVELSSGGIWTGFAGELLGDGDAERFETFRQELEGNKGRSE